MTFNDHVLPIFRNACLNCHNPDKKKAGLDLSTYSATVAGSDTGKILESGNPGASLLFKCVKQTEEPKMPPKGDRLTDLELAVVEKWITGQLLETASSKGVVASNNVARAVVSLTRPDGPPPMPGDLPLEPVVTAKVPNALVALAASPWAPLVAVGGQRQVVLYNTDSLQPLGVLPFPEGFPAVIRFSRNGELLITGGGLGGKSGKVVLWDVKTGERSGSVGDEFDQVLGADVSPDHAHVALGGPSKVLKIFATKDGKLEHTLKKHTDWVTAVAFSPDGKYLASGDRNGGITVWEGATGKEYNTLPGHKVTVNALAFMPGVLASASADGTIVLWDVKEGKELKKWNAHAGGTESVDFTPDGRIVSSGRDKLAKVWDGEGKILLTSPPFQDIALRAVLANERLIAGDWSGLIRVVSVADTKPLGELTSNPLSIADQLSSARVRVTEAEAKLAPLRQALEVSEAAYSKDREGKSATQPLGADVGPGKVDQSDAVKRVADLLKQHEVQIAEAAKLREARAKHADGSPEYVKANESVQAKKAEIAATEQTLAAAKIAAEGPQPTAPDSQLAKAKSEFEAAQRELSQATESLERWHRAQAFMIVYHARKVLEDTSAKYEDLVAAAKEATSPVEQARAGIVSAEETLANSPKALTDAEALLAATRTESEALSKNVGAAQDAVLGFEQKEKGVADELAVAIAAVPELEKKWKSAEAKVTDLQKQIDALVAEVSKRREVRGKQAPESEEYRAADAKVQAGKAEIAALESARPAETASLEVARKAHGIAAAKAKELQPQTESLKGQVAQAREQLESAKAAAASGSQKLTTAENALEKLRKGVESTTLKLTELKTALPGIITDAQVAKAAAEQEAVAVARELEIAKISLAEALATFESRYNSARKSTSASNASVPKG